MTTRAIILSILFCLCAGQVNGQQEFFPYLAEVTAQSVNVRAGQSRNFEKLTQLNKEDLVVVVGKSYSWYKVKLPSDAKIFISSNYVQLKGRDHGVVTANHVNVRAGADINYTILGSLNSGQRVEIIEKLKDWYAIKPVEGVFGWVSEDLIQFKSKDISLYDGKKDSQIELKKEEEKEEIEQIKEKKEDEKTIMVKGVLIPLRNALKSDIHHKLLRKDQSSYYIQGVKSILDEFLHYKVEIEGVLDNEEITPHESPVLKVKKIQLVI